jgi:hypothetical protein
MHALIEKANTGSLTPPFLANLEHIRLLTPHAYQPEDYTCYETYYVLMALSKFNKLPAIESFSIDGIARDPHADRKGETVSTAYPQGSSNISKIHIGHSAVGHYTLAALIQYSRELKELKCSTGGRHDIVDGEEDVPPIDPKKVVKALQQHSSTLRVLDLDLDAVQWIPCPDFTDSEDEEIYGSRKTDDEFEILMAQRHEQISEDDRKYGDTMGSLTDFTALTHLSIGIGILLGPPESQTGYPAKAPFRLVDGLPPKLEYLCIRGYEKGQEAEWDKQTQELMDAKEQRFPNLVIEGVDKKIEGASHVWGPKESKSGQPYEDPDDTDTEIEDHDGSDDSLLGSHCCSLCAGDYDSYGDEDDDDEDEEDDEDGDKDEEENGDPSDESDRDTVSDMDKDE